MTKFTKGPWEYDTCLADHGNKSTPIYSEADGADADLYEPVCIIPHDDITEAGYEQVKANAHLIAAAPDLYEALYKMSQYPDVRQYVGSVIHDIALNALAKARGEQ
jgi:hypothetical protein